MILLEAASVGIETYTVGGAIFAGLSASGLAIARVIKSFLAKYIKLQGLADLRIEKLVASVEILVEEIKRDRNTRALPRKP